MEAPQTTPVDLPQNDEQSNQSEGDPVTFYEQQLRIMLFGLLQLTHKIIDQTNPDMEPLEKVMIKCLDTAVKDWGLTVGTPAPDQELQQMAMKLEAHLKKHGGEGDDQQMQEVAECVDEILNVVGPDA
jgi:hypothetical protein